jgi:hypothetical protein
MELLKEIYELELGISERNAASTRHGGRFWFIRAAVGIVYNEAYHIAIIRHEDGRMALPAGMSEPGKDPLDGIRQGLVLAAATEAEELQLLELKLGEKQELGLVIEYLDEVESMRFAYGYAARARHDKTSMVANDSEIAARGVGWLSPSEAIAAMKRREPGSYEEKFVRARDLALLHHLLQLR